MDEQKLTMFKQAALQSGYSPEEVDSFVATASAVTPNMSPDSSYDPTGKTFAQTMAETGQQSTLDAMGKKGFDPSIELMPSPSRSFNAPTDVVDNSFFFPTNSDQQAIIPTLAQVTQPFGNRSSIEKYSGGVNLGTDFRVKSGTPLASPPGQWKVVEASPGWNGGSGNYVKLQNTKTGETVGYEHLAKIGVQPGQMVGGGVVVGLSGGDQGGSGRGNSTGAHASLPYTDSSGRYRDIRQSPYAQSLLGNSI